MGQRQEEPFKRRLLDWYRKSKKRHAWDSIEGAYEFLLVEILLQQTQIIQVDNILEDLLTRYPTIQSLNEATLEDIRESIHVLGMSKVKAGRLKRIAREVVERHNGAIPNNRKELLDLPGIGQYIANAILCFGFDKDVPLVDTNVVRLLNRVFGIISSMNRPRNDPGIWQIMKELTPKGNGKEFNLAILEFTSTICRHLSPACGQCPISSICKNKQQDESL